MTSRLRLAKLAGVPTSHHARAIALTVFAALPGCGVSFASDGPPRAQHPPSTVIRAVHFDLASLQSFADGSDNWAITWAADDHQYATWGDGGGFGGSDRDGRVPLGVARIEGGARRYRGVNVHGGVAPGRPATLGGKAYGILALGSVLYLWQSGDGSEASAFGGQRLWRSSDGAASWLPTDVARDAEHRIFAPTFLQAGRAYGDAPDAYVYTYAPEWTQDLWEVQRPGRIHLMRAARDAISENSGWQYFAGLGGDGARWTHDPAERVAVFEDAQNGVMRTSAIYQPALGRYLLVVQQVSRFRERDGHIGIYEAPARWGPWSTVLFASPWRLGLQNGSKSVFWNFSAKWTSADGRSFVLVYTGPGADAWGSVEGHFDVDLSSRRERAAAANPPR